MDLEGRFLDKILHVVFNVVYFLIRIAGTLFLSVKTKYLFMSGE